MRAEWSFVLLMGVLALPRSLAAQPAASSDPNLDRGFLLPTAMTQPAGTITYNNYELLVNGLTFALTDRLQISGTVIPPVAEGWPLGGSAGVKAQVYQRGSLRLAVQGSVTYLTIYEDDDDGGFVAGGVNLLASACLRSDCSSLLSASVAYQHLWLIETDDVDTLIYGASLVHGLGRHVKLLLEVVSAATAERIDGDRDVDHVPALLASYGLRFHGGWIAGDVGLMKPILFEDDDHDRDWVLGLPYVSFSVRW